MKSARRCSPGGAIDPGKPPVRGRHDARPTRPRTWRCAVLVALTAAALVACGGGGGEETVPPPTALPAALAPVVPQTSQQSGTAVAFAAGVADPAKQLRYQWQFGDGSSSTAAAPSHAYALPGSYSVQLTVTNEAGEVRTAQSTVTVADLALVQGRQCKRDVGASSTNSTAAGWCWQRPLPQGNFVADVTVADSGLGFAAGAAGTLLKTTDSGLNWTGVNLPTEQDLIKVVAVNAQVVWLAALNGELLVTSNGGADWQTTSLGANESALTLGASSASKAWVLTQNGSRYATSDGGRTWRRTPLPTNLPGSLFSAADGSVWLVPTFGYTNDSSSYGMVLARSADDGALWVQAAMPPLAQGLSRNVSSVQVTSARRALLRTQDSGFDAGIGNFVSTSRLWLTADGGASWQPATPAPNDQNFSGLSYQLSGTDTLSVFNGASAYRSSDGGATWTTVPLPSEPLLQFGLQRVQHLGDLRYLATSYDGRNWFTRDAGANWAELRTGSDFNQPMLSSVHYFDRREGLVIARDGSSLRTADGGLTWAASAQPNNNGSFFPGWRQARFLPGADVGWVISDSGTIFRTTDRGRTWAAPVPQTSAVMVGLTDFHFIDALRGFAVANQSFNAQATIFGTRNGGQSWQAVAGTDAYFGLTAVRFADDGQNGVAVGYAGLVLLTNDGGATWTPRNLGLNVTLKRLLFVDGTRTVLGVGDNGVVMRSADRGLTWRRMATPTDAALNDVVFTSSQTGWAAGDQGTLLKTNDGGLSWQTQSSGTRASLQGLHFVDGSTGWVVGSNGTILVTISGGG